MDIMHIHGDLGIYGTFYAGAQWTSGTLVAPACTGLLRRVSALPASPNLPDTPRVAGEAWTRDAQEPRYAPKTLDHGGFAVKSNP